MPSADEILATFPEFVPAPAAQPVYVALAEKQTADLPEWGDEADLRNLAVALRAAGMMVDLGLVGSVPASSGVVSSERIGSLAVSYAVPQGAGENPATNAYWRRLADLIAQNFMAPRTSLG